MAEKSLRAFTRATTGRITDSVQVFKTMQGVHAWIGPFDIVFAAYCCGIFSLVIEVLRCFNCRLLNVVNIVYHFLT